MYVSFSNFDTDADGTVHACLAGRTNWYALLDGVSSNVGVTLGTQATTPSPLVSSRRRCRLRVQRPDRPSTPHTAARESLDP